MSRAVAVLVIGAAAVLVGAARSQPDSAARAAANRATFEDARGENAVGIDISQVVVTSTAEGEIAFRVEIPTNPVFTDDMRVRIWVDADENSATGESGGDYFLLADNFGANLYACDNPPACDVFAPPPQISFEFEYRDGATFTVAADELGRTERFRFSVSAYDGLVYTPGVGYDFENAHFDFAPSRDEWWTYDTRALVVKSFSARPASPRAGRPFTLTLTTVRTDTGDVVRGRVRCSFNLRGKPLRATAHGFTGDRARCAYAVPPSSGGLRFRSSISVTAAGHTLTRSVSGRVR